MLIGPASSFEHSLMPKVLFGEAFSEHFDPRNVVLFCGAKRLAPDRNLGFSMRAITVSPGQPGSERLEDVPDPPASDGPILVRTVALGVCGTDRDIVAGEYGWAPPGENRLVLGHESLGRVEQAPAGAGVVPGDLVVGIVRRPDPVPCPACAVGEWDMCRNGRYTERGIKERN